MFRRAKCKNCGDQFLLKHHGGVSTQTEFFCPGCAEMKRERDKLDLERARHQMERETLQQDRAHQREMMQISRRKEDEKKFDEQQLIAVLTKNHDLACERFRKGCKEREKQHERALTVLQRDHDLASERFRKECEERDKHRQHQVAVLQKEHDLACERYQKECVERATQHQRDLEMRRTEHEQECERMRIANQGKCDQIRTQGEATAKMLASLPPGTTLNVNISFKGGMFSPQDPPDE